MRRFVESDKIEYKKILNDTFEKEVVAFLNSREGGCIYIGVDTKTDVVFGIESVDAVQLQISNRIRNNILPSALGLFDVSLEEMEGRNVIKTIVAAGYEKPYYIKKYGMSEKGCFIRKGSASEPMSSEMIEDLFSKRVRNTIGILQSPQQKLGFEQLKIFYQENGVNPNEKFIRSLELLTQDDKYNYAAYLLADKNGISIKVAKYDGINRIDLVENNEYGYCCLVKAAKNVLEKLDVENSTYTQITPKERLQKRKVDETALREAVINAIVHNDYSYEAPPKFELFSDRIEITSTGGLPFGLGRDDFFSGVSVPRNKELMRVFKDLELVEHLGSGIPRILEKYDKSVFYFADSFIRIVFPFTESYGVTAKNINPELQPELQPESLEQKILLILKTGEFSKSDISTRLGHKQISGRLNEVIRSLLKEGVIEYTIPEKPNSRLQKYRLTKKAKHPLFKRNGEIK